MLLEVYSDGSAEEQVGRPGGWAFVIVRDDVLLAQGHGAEPKTTSLLMELRAALEGLQATVALEAGEVVLISDSRIVLEVAAGQFKPKPAGVAALSTEVREVALRVRAGTKWVRAHSGHRWNEQVDDLAHQARVQLKAQLAERRRRR